MNIWWIRRDLRLGDNPALMAALNAGTGVLPVFILDDHLLSRPAEKRQSFLFAGLRALEADLRRLGSGLIVRRGHPASELARLVAESGATAVYAAEDVSPYARRRDAEAASTVNLKLVGGLGVHPPAAVTRPDGKPYTVFTPYSRVWKALPFDGYVLQAPDGLPPIPDLTSEILPDLPPPPEDFPAGEAEALNRLDAFLDGPIYYYETYRNRLDLEGTSMLSPYLRFGMVSARQAVAGGLAAADSAPDGPARVGCEVWLNELIWREFFQSILYHFPQVLSTAFKPRYRKLRWRNDSQELAAWQEGRTGYPVVDAAMRQLAQTGWMHNRGRMIAASFLVKHLLINWQEGERWFMRTLIDGDPAANNGGWQWVAGTGTDAAPYFRVFNPILQGKKFDPRGNYIRQWVPELSAVPLQHIHAPWEMSSEEQQASGVIIGQDYPAPIVNHEAARQRALAVYRRF